MESNHKPFRLHLFSKQCPFQTRSLSVKLVHRVGNDPTSPVLQTSANPSQLSVRKLADTVGLEPTYNCLTGSPPTKMAHMSKFGG